MTQFHLALVEDNEQDIQACEDSIERYRDEKKRDIDLRVYRSLEEALRNLDNSFDGAIIDLKLDLGEDEGNQVVEKIKNSNLRMPIAILTGTPESADMDIDYIGVYKKGEKQYIDLVDAFWEINDTGLTRIMGGRGIIEETLNRVFRTNILPQKSTWVSHGKADPTRTEKALLRHILNHLLQILDESGGRSFPEEVYLYPSVSAGLKTGSILKKKDDGSFFMILSPACDMVIRDNGAFKTDRILLVAIELHERVLSTVVRGIAKEEKRKGEVSRALGNNYTLYYHWLPSTSFFPGGFLNFRKLTTVGKDELSKAYGEPDLQLSPFFLKDVVARFSSFYARQGQPDIEIGDGAITELLQASVGEQ